MRILVTNDDGIESTGLHVLAERLSEIGSVTVFAPSGEYSGAGAAIGHLGAGIPDVHQVTRSEMPSVAAVYHLDGPPALATLLACRGLFGEVPDLVVSGINPGWNVGHSVHFSGTVGAGITAQVFNTPAIAVSQRTTNNAASEQQWQSAADAAAALVDDVLANPRLLNVNLANLATAELKGVKQTTLSGRIPYSMHSLRMTPLGNGSSGVSFARNGEFEGGPGTDTEAVENGWISVTEILPSHATQS